MAEARGIRTPVHPPRFHGLRPLLLLTLALSAGCATVPRRRAAVIDQYPARPAPPTASSAAIPSEYQDYADRAFAASTPGAPAHFAQLLSTGDDALLARLHLIRAATNSIDIQTFIWKDDPVTRVLFAELLRAADRGVRVRLLVDALFPIASPRDTARMAEAHEHIELCLFNPMSNVAWLGKVKFLQAGVLRLRDMNRRMHSKTFTVDGRIAIVGGRNNEGKYYDRHPDFVFKDRDVAVMGPVARDIQASFEEFWTHRKSVYAMQFADIRAEYPRVVNRPLPVPSPADRAIVGDLLDLADAPALSALRDSLAIQPVASVQFVADTPSRATRAMHFLPGMTTPYRQLLRSAKERLVFQTPYLIYDPRQRRDLKRARKDHPDLDVVVSGNSLAAADHVHVYAISYKHRRALLRKTKMDIYEFKPAPGDFDDFIPGHAAFRAATGATNLPRVCIHAKTLVIDGQTVLVGSHNFDPRSSNLNAECGLLIGDPAFAARVEQELMRAIAPQNSWTVARQPVPDRFGPRFRQSLGSISSRLPLFDILPQVYVSLYEPLDGQDALPPGHPGFYETHRNVGQFPGVDDPATLKNMHRIKAFGGWLRPIL